MAGVLRRLKPTLAPTGRVVRLHRLVDGNPRESAFVEFRLGAPENKADYVTGFCLARKKGQRLRPVRRPAKDSV